MGGVPAHYIMKTKDYADKCKENTPVYDLENYRKNFREEVNLICDRMGNIACEIRNRVRQRG